MNDAEKLQALETYFRLMSMKGAVEVFHSATRAGILQALTGGAKSGADVAAFCGLDARATGLVLDALAAMGLVTASDTGYAPAPVLQLLKGTYADLSSQYWNHLPDYLASGRPMQRMDDPAEGMKQYAVQAGALYWMMLPSAVAAARMLGIGQARRNLRIVDIGAGSGVWSLIFAQHDSGARVTAVDWPAVLNVATDMAHKHGLSERFTTCPGDYHTVALDAESYDLAIAANVAHLENTSRLAALFRRLHGALRPGGSLLVVDVFHGQPAGALSSALYELGLALRTTGGRVHERAALEACLREGGFIATSYQAIPVTPFTMGFILAQKGT